MAGAACDSLEETGADAPPPVSVVAAWLAGAAYADAKIHSAVGLGRDLRLSGPKLSGAALECEGTAIHLLLFAAAGNTSNRGRSVTRIARPSVHRRG